MGCLGNILERNTGVYTYIYDLKTSVQKCCIDIYSAYIGLLCIYTHMHATDPFI